LGAQGNGDGQFSGAARAVVNSESHIYITDEYNHRVQKFDRNGIFLSWWGGFGTSSGLFNQPIGVAVDSEDNVYVVDSRNNRIQKFDPNGIYLNQWGAEGDGPGEFQNPQGITIDKNDNVFVADTSNCRVQKFSKEGTHLTTWGLGENSLWFSLTHGITSDSQGNIIIAEGFQIQKLTSDGIPVVSWGEFGQQPGQFSWPMDIITDYYDHTYVLDYDNLRVQVFTPYFVYSLSWLYHNNSIKTLI